MRCHSPSCAFGPLILYNRTLAAAARVRVVAFLYVAHSMCLRWPIVLGRRIHRRCRLDGQCRRRCLCNDHSALVPHWCCTQPCYATVKHAALRASACSPLRKATCLLACLLGETSRTGTSSLTCAGSITPLRDRSAEQRSRADGAMEASSGHAEQATARRRKAMCKSNVNM